MNEALSDVENRPNLTQSLLACRLSELDGGKNLLPRLSVWSPTCWCKSVSPDPLRKDQDGLWCGCLWSQLQDESRSSHSKPSSLAPEGFHVENGRAQLLFGKVKAPASTTEANIESQSKRELTQGWNFLHCLVIPIACQMGRHQFLMLPHMWDTEGAKGENLTTIYRIFQADGRMTMRRADADALWSSNSRISCDCLTRNTFEWYWIKSALYSALVNNHGWWRYRAKYKFKYSNWFRSKSRHRSLSKD